MGLRGSSAIFPKDTDAACAFLEGLLQDAPVGIACYDGQGRYIVVNDALAMRNGTSVVGHSGRHVRDVVPSEAATIERAIARVLASGAAVTIAAGAEVVHYYPVRMGLETIGVGAIHTSATTPALPDDRQDASDRECSAAAEPLEGACILIVDDDPDARDLFFEIVASAGAAALVAASAEEALEILRSRHADVIVCDVGMPGCDGYTFIRELRASGEEVGAWTPAIALTGYASERDSQTALLAGFQLHLPKPVDPPLLLDSLVRLWRRGSRDNTP
ncbi:MAG: response regulator [Myxococcota bacterium]|nr:response regulator [Myxococcota bacterium]